MNKDKQRRSTDGALYLDLISQETYEDLLMVASDLTDAHGRKNAAEALSAIAVGLRYDMTLRQLDDDILMAWRYLSREAERIQQEREEEAAKVERMKKAIKKETEK